MKTENSNLMIFATIAVIVAVVGNFISASVLLQTKSNLWIIFSAVAVGASLLGAYTALVASRKQSVEESISKAQIFLSYAKEDAEQAEKIYKKLETEGFKTWMDVKNIHPGENWAQSIKHAIENSDFLVVLISKNSVGKQGFIQKEINIALDLTSQESRQNIRIIPVRLDNTPIPEPLTTFHSVNLFDENGFSNLIGSLQIIPNDVKR